MRGRLIPSVVLLVMLASGCAGLWRSFKSVAAPVAGGLGGAALGSLGGPIGTFVGAGLGAGLGDAIEENAAFRSGEVVGERALEKEVERWRRRALFAGEVLEAAQETEGRAVHAMSMAERGKAWAIKWFWRAAWCALAYFIFLRRKPLWEFFTKKVVISRPWALAHAFIGANWTRIKAYGYDYMPKAEPVEAPVPVAAPAAPAPRRRRAKPTATTRSRKRRKAIHA